MSDREALLGDNLGSAGFELKRPRRDAAGAFVYFTFMIAALIGGAVSIHRSNWKDLYAILAKPDDPSICPIQGPPRSHNLLQWHQLSEPEPQSYLHLATPAGIWLGVALAASVSLGIGFLGLFFSAPKLATRTAVTLQVAVPAVLGLGALAFVNAGLGGFLLLQAAAAGVMLLFWWKHLDLCEQLLGISARALSDNRGIIVFSLLAQLVVLVLSSGFGILTGYGLTNGRILPNNERLESEQGCTNAAGDPTPCCTWQVDNWGSVYASFATIMTLWTTLLVKEIRVFVTSGVVAQWYFSPAGTSTQGATRRSLGHALGPSFGSLSIGSAILTLVNLARNAIEEAQRKQQEEGGGAGIATMLLACVAELLFQFVEFLTKFTTVACAITGQAFFQAGRNAVDLLKRNALSTGAVWFFPQLIVGITALTLSIAAGLLTAGGVRLTWPDPETAMTATIALGVICLVLSLVVLLFLGNILLDIVDAAYFCYAMDLDSQRVTRSDIHDVLSKVPAGVAVEQPGGELAYGAPAGGSNRRSPPQTSSNV